MIKKITAALFCLFTVSAFANDHPWQETTWLPERDKPDQAAACSDHWPDRPWMQNPDSIACQGSAPAGQRSGPQTG